ncbi:MAG: hypothetical protein U0T73_07755 [Chitinophagales bacterium]
MRRFLLLLLLFNSVTSNAHNYTVDPSMRQPVRDTIKNGITLLNAFFNDPSVVDSFRLGRYRPSSQVPNKYQIASLASVRSHLDSPYNIQLLQPPRTNQSAKDDRIDVVVDMTRIQRDTCRFLDGSSLSLNAVTASMWILFMQGATYHTVTYTRENLDLALGSFLVSMYEQYLRRTYPNFVIPKIPFDINCKNKQIPDEAFRSMIVADASYLISGKESKLKQSKISLELVSPDLNFSIDPISKESSNFSFQIGADLKSKDPINKLITNNPNFQFTANVNIDYILWNISKGKFNYDSCIQCQLQSYHLDGRRNESLDSFYRQSSWNTKYVHWLSFKLDGGVQNYSVFDKTLGDQTFKSFQGLGTLSFSYNIHHYVNPNYSGTQNAGVNFYLRAGLDFLYANMVDIVNAKGTTIQEFDSVSPNRKVIKSEVIAFDKDSFTRRLLGLSPSVNFYAMDKSRHIGFHLAAMYKFGAVDNGQLIHSAFLGFGVFGSINNSLFSKSAKSNDEKSLLNIEVFLKTRNVFDFKNSGKTFSDLFIPEIKFEIPFTLLKH